jgi:hypothetical protein
MKYTAYMMENGKTAQPGQESAILSLRLRSSIILLKGLKYIRP